MKKTLQLIAVLIIFPALLAIVGFWELERYHEYGSVPAVADVEVQHKIAKLEKLKVDVMKDSHITITVNGKKYGSSAAASMIQKEIDSLSGNSGSTVLHDKTLAQVVVVLCKIMIGAGILGALVGMLGLLLATIGGRLAYQSMDRLISIFSVCRKWLPFLLAAITLLLTLAVISLTVIEGVGTINALMNDSAMSKGEFKIRLVLLMLGCSLAYLGFMAVLNLRKAIGVFGSQPMVLLGRQVTEDQAAGLWEYVRNLAQRMGAPVPKNIVVGLNDGFFVTAHDIVLEPTQEHITGETLFIPLSWAVLLHKDEIEFILGHELGHFCGLDTEYSLRFLPIYNGMERSLAALSQVGGWTEKPAIMLGEFLFERFDYAVHYWGRKREYGADQLGASITGAGNRAAARALLRISSIMPIINEVMSDVARQPEKVPADLLQWLVERAREKGFEDPRNNLDDVAIHPTDTHPPTQRRVEALGVELGDNLAREVMEAIDDRGLKMLDGFFSDRVALAQQLSGDLIGVSHERKEAIRAELEELVEEQPDDRELWEKTGLQFFACGIVGAGFIAAWGFIADKVLSKSSAVVSSHDLLLSGGLLLGGILFLGFAVVFYKRSKRAIIKFTAQGLSGGTLKQPILWSDIVDLKMTVTSGSYGSSCAIKFILASEAPKPELSGSNLRRLSYKKSKRTFVVQLFVPKGIKHEELLELIQRFRRADYARRELEQFQ